MIMENNESNNRKIHERLESLELRLTRIESKLEIEKGEMKPVQEEGSAAQMLGIQVEKQQDRGSLFESKLGQYGLGWIGNIVLLFGITFFSQYIHNSGLSILSISMGYLSAVLVLFTAYALRKSYSYLALLFNLNGALLFYYFTLRIHFFTQDPVISNKPVALSLIMFVVLVQIILSVRKNSEVFTGIAVIMILATAIISNSIHFCLALITVSSAITVFLFFTKSWYRLLNITVVLVYISFLLWILSNPILGNKLEIISDHYYGYIFLFAIGFTYSMLPFTKPKDTVPGNFIARMIVVNGLAFSFILLLFVLGFFSENYTTIFIVITAGCLIFSVILRLLSDWKISAAFYAVYGFVAMSVVFYSIYTFPLVYWVLSAQSLLVVAMALWFRNRFIIIMNGLLFTMLLTVYLTTSEHIDTVNFSFAIVALLTARILNWKKERLQVKSDMLRNFYLIIAFSIVLYSLQQAVPKQYVTFSWTLAAMFYFGLSVLLKNVKYRYMALGTIISAAFYLFIIDLASIEIIYRVLALLFLAIISLGASIYYFRRIRK